MGSSSVPVKVGCAASNDVHPSLDRVTRFTPRCSCSTMVVRDVIWRMAIEVPCSS
jgi:hypothetical protein